MVLHPAGLRQPQCHVTNGTSCSSKLQKQGSRPERDRSFAQCSLSVARIAKCRKFKRLWSTSNRLHFRSIVGAFDLDQAKIVMVDCFTLTTMASQFVAKQSHYGICPWLHLPGVLGNIIPENICIQPPKNRSTEADSQATVAAVLELVFMSAQNSIASKNLSKSSMQALQPSAYLSRIELACCWCRGDGMATHTNAPKYIATFADAFSILTDQLKAFEASKNTATVLQQVVSSDLLIAVAQHATLHLRDNITFFHPSVDHSIGVLVEVACLDHNPEAVISTFVKTGEHA